MKGIYYYIAIDESQSLKMLEVIRCRYEHGLLINFTNFSKFQKKNIKLQ